MDRKGQLGNVAFGGAWSEQIPRKERIAQCVEIIQQAPGRAEEEDLRQDEELALAIDYIGKNHPKGHEIKRSWTRALGLESPALRQSELHRLARVMTAWTPIG